MVNSLAGKAKSVLAVGAHPDDIEILCAGTLAKYCKQGSKVAIAIATDGSAGHKKIPPEKLAKIRRQEAQKAAELIGAYFYWIGYQDEMIRNDIDTRLQFTDIIRQTKPDVILTHAPNDYHPDHRVVSQLVFDSSFVSGLSNVKTSFPAHPGVPVVMYFDTLAGIHFEPTSYVDITDFFKVKKEMLKCHQSQLKFLQDQNDMDVMELIEITARMRGFQCGVKYAEAFRMETVWPRARTYRVLP